MTKTLLQPKSLMERSGRCSNYGECHKADSKDVIEVADGADFLCPVCASALEEALTGQKKKRRAISPMIIVIGGVLVLLTGGIIFFFSQNRTLAAPKDFQANAESANSVFLSWEEIPAGCKAEIERSPSPDQGFTEILQAEEGAISILDATVAPDTSYYYRVRFDNGVSKTPYSSEQNVKTPKPAPTPAPIISPTPGPIISPTPEPAISPTPEPPVSPEPTVSTSPKPRPPHPKPRPTAQKDHWWQHVPWNNLPRPRGF
jgi:hypothetical protein